jgi:hypothetical protein
MIDNKFREQPQAKDIAYIIRRNFHPDSYEASSRLTSRKGKKHTVKTFKFKKPKDNGNFKHTLKKKVEKDVT